VFDHHTSAAAAGAQQRLDGAFVHGLRHSGGSSADVAVSGSSSGSSSSNRSDVLSGSACSTSFKRPVQAHLLSISPVHERLQLLPADWRQLYLQEVQNTDESMDDLLLYLRATLQVLNWHMFHALAALEKQEQQRQQQQKHSLAANSTPAAAPALAPPGVAAAAAAADAPELSPTCSFITCPVTAEQAVLLVIELLQLLAAMSEQAAQRLRYGSLRAYSCGALLLQRQLEVLQRCPALRERHSSVVQQSAQQLMQLLRWQLQQAAQRSPPPWATTASAWQEVVDDISNVAKETLFYHLVDVSGACLQNGVQTKHMSPSVACSNAQML
jgi:hypothetical protein